MAALTFPASFDAPITERLEWLTDVITTRNRKEQRIRMRQYPRRSFEFRIACASELQRATVENWLTAHQSEFVDVPIWPDVQFTAAAMTAGATSIAIPTTGIDFDPFGTALVVFGYSSEVVAIDTINPTELTIMDPLVNNWPAGTAIVPLREARIDDALPVTNPWLPVAQFVVRASLALEWAVTPATESADYAGYPVLGTADNSDAGVTQNWRRSLEVIDSKTGRRQWYDLSGLESVSRSRRVVTTTRAATAEFRAWLAARAGQCNPIWLPSLTRDIELSTQASSGATSWTVKNAGLADAFQVGRRDVLVELANGTRYYRRITAVTAVDAATETVTIASGVPAILPTTTRISFMRLARLDADAVEIAYPWPGVAESKFTLMSVRDDLGD